MFKLLGVKSLGELSQLLKGQGVHTQKIYFQKKCVDDITEISFLQIIEILGPKTISLLYNNVINCFYYSYNKKLVDYCILLALHTNASSTNKQDNNKFYKLNNYN